MGKYPTEAEDRIRIIKEKATCLEQARSKAYEDRLQEIVAETMTWNIPAELVPMEIARRAFRLGRDFGAGKMYEYI